jgi:hypothetical protein
MIFIRTSIWVYVKIKHVAERHKQKQLKLERTSEKKVQKAFLKSC